MLENCEVRQSKEKRQSVDGNSFHNITYNCHFKIISIVREYKGFGDIFFNKFKYDESIKNKQKTLKDIMKI